MAIPHNIKNLLRTDNDGNQTEDLTGGILPEVDGSNLTGVIGNTYIAPVDPGPNEDGFGNSLTFSGTRFQIGQGWFNFTTEKLFRCVSNLSGKARWNENLQSFGSNFVSLAGSSILRGSVVRLDNSSSAGTLPVVVEAVDGDDGIVGVAAVDASSTPLEDVTFQVISVGIVKVRVTSAEANWTRGDAVYLSALPGVATSTPTSRLIGYAAKAATTGTILRDIFVGFGSGGGMGDLHTVMQNKKLIDADYSLDPDYNGVMAGPVTIDVGVTLDVPLGSRLVIL